MDGWMDGWLASLRLSVKSGRCAGDNERLCTMELERGLPELRTVDQQANALPTEYGAPEFMGISVFTLQTDTRRTLFSNMS